MARFFVVPQWQGSPSARAMLLQGGAEAIAGDLPQSACTTVDVPLEAGDALGSRVHRLSALTRVRTALRNALEDTTEHSVVVGGDCSVAVGAIEHATQKHPRLAVLWFDAHADLHTPDTSPSGAYAGMALRAALGDGELPSRPAADPHRVILSGVREFDDAERDAVEELGLAHLSVDDLAHPEDLGRALADADADACYIHVDLDVLDPASITGVTGPVPFGLDVPTLTAAISAARGRLPLVGASVSGFAPTSTDAAVEDLGAILRVIGSLA